MRRRPGGFTLIEILVVLSLLGILMGLSIGFVQRAGQGNLLIQTTNKTASLLASARSQSFGNDTAYVSIERGPDGRVVLQSFRKQQVFHWPCEDFKRASELDVMSHTGQVDMGDVGVPSREGKYVVFEGGGRVMIRNVPWLQWIDGFSIKCRIFPQDAGGLAKMALFAKGSAIRIHIVRVEAGRFDVEAVIKLDKGDEGTETYQVRTGFRDGAEVPEWGGPLLAGRWYDLRVTYDRNEFGIFVNENERGRRSDKRHKMKPDFEQPLIIGAGYAGGFDSLVIGGIFEDQDDAWELPEQVAWIDAAGKTAAGPRMIHFRNRGLDPRHHSGPVELHFKLGEGEEKGARRHVRVAASGETFVRRPGE